MTSRYESAHYIISWLPSTPASKERSAGVGRVRELSSNSKVERRLNRRQQQVDNMEKVGQVAAPGSGEGVAEGLSKQEMEER